MKSEIISTLQIGLVTLDKYKKIKRFDSYKIIHRSEELCAFKSFRRPQ